MRAAKQAGYRTQGGHDIPDTDIRRRYSRSLFHAPEAIRLAAETVVLDNSGTQPEPMLMSNGGQIIWRACSLPQWVLQLTSGLEDRVKASDASWP